MRNAFRGLMLLLPGLLLLAACSPSTSTSAAPTATTVRPVTSPAAVVASPVASPSAAGQAAGGNTVNLTDNLRFEPATLTVSRGTTVTWRNTSQTVHTVTDDPSKATNAADAQLASGTQAWDSGNLNPGQTFTHTFDTPGTYKYFCQPHEAAGMVGTIVVTP